MTTSPLDRVYTFLLDAPLSDADADALRDIPGVGVWRARPGITVPLNAGQEVVDLLEARGIRARVKQPAAFVPDGGLRTSEVFPWVYDGSTDWKVAPFQIDAAVACRKRGGGHIWSSAGSGKTLIAILFAFSFLLPIVVVTATKALRQWRDEGIAAFTSAEPFLVRGASKLRKRDEGLEAYVDRMYRESKRPVILIGWDLLTDFAPLLCDLFAGSGTFGHVGFTAVFDEAHRGKQLKRAQWIPTVEEVTGADGAVEYRDGLKEQPIVSMSAAAANLAAAATYRLATTASPVYNRVGSDVWGILTLIEPRGWGKTARRFQLRYADGKLGDFGLVAKGLSNVEELQARLAHTVKRIPHSTTHSQLPPLRNRVVWVSVDQQDKPLSWGSERGAVKAAESEWARGNAAAKGRVAEFRRMEAASRKRSVVLDMAREYLVGDGKRKVVVFTGRKVDCDTLAARLSKTVAAVDGACFVGHGDTPMDEREEIRKAYMAHPGPAVLIGTWQAWGESLNLHDTDALILAMLPITPGELVQVRGRVHRLGMSRPCVCVFVCAEQTIDERCVQIVLSKVPHVETLTDAGPFAGMADALRGWDDEGRMYDAILAAIRPAGDADVDENERIEEGA